METKDNRINLEDPLDVIVVGASGDLAGRKIFPALFSLFSQGLLPENTRFFGFARSAMTHDELRDKIKTNLTCRYTPERSCGDYINDFLSRTFYQNGQYDDPNSYLDLYELMTEKSETRRSNYLFYLAIPPSLFAKVCSAIGDSGLVHCGAEEPWTRVVVEKPFGRDRASSDQLGEELHSVFEEEQIYRIDHYLGKEVVQNIQVARFANEIFEPLWNRSHIDRVDISWSENLGVEGRGGYFDNYGIIRDVIQNHLLQILALIAMEEPASLSALDVRNRKVELLRAVSPLKLEDVVVGQYTAGAIGKREMPGYRQDATVADDSLTPTFAKVRLRIDNDRWNGVPFTIRAGKGLAEKKTEVKIRFKASDANIFCALGQCPPPNELIIRVQPDEGMNLNIVNKVPGFQMRFNEEKLDLSYKSSFRENVIPEAYESLLLDVVRGEKTLFIRNDELQVAWDVFTPVLKELEDENIEPKPYAFGSLGPA